MKWSHGIGFFAIGAVMLALPQWAPGLCVRDVFDGTSGRELWLQFMGCLQTGMGGTVLMRSAVAGFIASLRQWPQVLADIWGGILPERDADLCELKEAAFRDGKVVPVDFATKATWNQRQAA